MGRLQDKVAVITGGCSGIGLAASKLFLAEGARIVIVCAREKGLALEQEYSGRLRFLQGDIRQTDIFARAVELAVDTFGGLDIFYHNAGATGAPQGFAELTEQGWDDVQNLLLRSSAFAVKHAIPTLCMRGGGSIILTSSVGATNIAHNSELRLPAYAIAKAAVLTLGHLAALDLAKHQIRVNTIVPGAFPTSIFGDQAGVSGTMADRMAPHLRKAFAQFQPLPRAGEAIDAAEAALFLASDASRFITGTDLYVDGGLNHHRPKPASFLAEAIIEARQLAEKGKAAS